MTRHTSTAGLLTLALWALPPASGAPAAADLEYELFPNPVVARGKGFVLHQSDLDRAVVGLKATMATQGQRFPEAQRAAVEDRVLNRMILTKTLLGKATSANKREARETADAFIAETKKRTRSEAAYRRQLIAVGITVEAFEERAYEQAVVEAVINHEIRDQLAVTGPQLQDFYNLGIDTVAREAQAELDRLLKEGKGSSTEYKALQRNLEETTKANLNRLERPELVRADLIVSYTRNLAAQRELPPDERAIKRRKIDEALARVRAGETFATVARDVSDDPDARRTGGEYTTPREAIRFPELQAALFTLPIGQISDVITTRVGFYIAKVRERTPPGKVSFADAEPDIRNVLLSQEVEKRLPDYYEKLKAEFKVEILRQPTAER